MNVHDIAADIARRIPEMALDSVMNNSVVIEGVIDAVLDDANIQLNNEILMLSVSVANLNELLNAEKSHAEKAEAAFGELRMLVAFLSCCCNSGESLNAEDKKQIQHALSTDCGKAMLERVERLRSALERISQLEFGWDGDCGAASIAKQALEESK